MDFPFAASVSPGKKSIKRDRSQMLAEATILSNSKRPVLRTITKELAIVVKGKTNCTRPPNPCVGRTAGTKRFIHSRP
jgi:hypothetical protein